MSRLLMRMSKLGAIAVLPLLTACGPEELPTGAPAPELATASEDLIPSNPFPTLDFCSFASPDAVLNIGSVASVSAVSPNPGYAYRSGCISWVVDIQVPSNMVQVAGYQNWASLVGTPVDSFPLYNVSQTSCESYSARRTLYKQAAGTANFVKVDGRTYRGTWVTAPDFFPTPRCELTSVQTTSDYFVVLPPASGTDVYRVVSQAQMDGVYRNVKGGAWRISRIP